MVLKGHPRGKTTDLVQALSEKTTSVASKIHLPKVNRAFHLLVSLLWPIFCEGPRRLTFYVQVVWASEWWYPTV